MPEIATIAAVIGETVRPKLVMICIGKMSVTTSTFRKAAIFGVRAAKEKMQRCQTPSRKQQVPG